MGRWLERGEKGAGGNRRPLCISSPARRWQIGSIRALRQALRRGGAPGALPPGLASRERRRGVDKLAQPLEPYQLVFEARKACVEAARVGQHENSGAANQLGLGARAGGRGSRWRADPKRLMEPCRRTRDKWSRRRRRPPRAADAESWPSAVRLPRSISSRPNSAAARVARGQRLVSARPNSASRRSSVCVSSTGTSPAAYSSRQNGLPGPAK